ncbi:uncharacterized protein LOC112543349 [Python bivittatus]|uniref:Uncharacterized protein LOC112543349 n=1 Tax=Python bivittatus TaxID=176946 RepID=A0A9F5N2F6_PYTBI|nr:uncharacterized protein LOC112543349 [Python bivittatus]
MVTRGPAVGGGAAPLLRARWAPLSAPDTDRTGHNGGAHSLATPQAPPPAWRSLARARCLSAAAQSHWAAEAARGDRWHVFGSVRPSVRTFAPLLAGCLDMPLPRRAGVHLYARLPPCEAPDWPGARPPRPRGEAQAGNALSRAGPGRGARGRGASRGSPSTLRRSRDLSFARRLPWGHVAGALPRPGALEGLRPLSSPAGAPEPGCGEGRSALRLPPSRASRAAPGKERAAALSP